MKYTKIIVTGGSGMVGKSLQKILPNAIYLSSKDYNLYNEADVINMYSTLQPDCVIHLAAKVGGIMDNINHPGIYYTQNILMNTLLIEYARIYNVKRFIGILSTCIYPDQLELYPLKESDLHLGPPTPTNFSYGYAKRSMAVQIDSYNKEFHTNYQYLIPSNMYGEYDKFDDKTSHFVASLIKKIHYAKLNNENKITLFGTGNPLRQFMHSDDFAYIIKYFIENDIFENLNVCSNETYTIKEIATIALSACNATHLKIEFDSNFPDGQYRKDVSMNALKNILPEFNPIDLHTGIQQTYDYIVKNNIL